MKTKPISNIVEKLAMICFPFNQLKNASIRLIGFASTLIIIIFACSNPPDAISFFNPQADFEEQESTMICWNPKFQQVIVPVVSEISSDDHVTLFYNENYHSEKRINNLLAQHNSNMKNIDIVPFKLEKDNIWIRDYGPSFTRNESGDLSVVGFDYPHLEFHDYKQFSLQYATKLKYPFLKSKINSTGGGREINGRGTIILIEGYEKVVNPGLSKQEIEEEYREKFGQRNFIWFRKGIPQDDFLVSGPIIDDIYGFGVNWHVDEFCRFADPNTILLAEVDEADILRDDFYRIIHERLEENYQVLLESRDQDGNPFEIIRVPQAPVIFANGFLDTVDIFYTPVTSYLNFVITNNSVIIPTYYVDQAPDYVREKDEKAVKVFQKAFASRTIKKVDAIDLNKKGGGLHCMTMHKPKQRQKQFFDFITRKRRTG